jgi:hypothetical protein
VITKKQRLAAGLLAITAVAGLGATPARATPAAPSVARAYDSVKPGVVRGGTWFLRNTPTTGGPDRSVAYGLASDLPLTGDWDGNGTKTPGVFRAGVFYLRNDNSSGVADITVGFGGPGDTPIVGDWDGNNTDTVGVVRSGVWYFRNFNTSGVADFSFAYGAATGDIPVVGDWDANGTATPAVVRFNSVPADPNTVGVFFDVLFRNSNTPGVAEGSQRIQVSWGTKLIVGNFRPDGSPEQVNTFNLGGRADWITAGGVFTFGATSDVPITWR